MKAIAPLRRSLPYLLLAICAAILVIAFTRAELLRRQTDDVLRQASEIQWRISKLREQSLIASGNVAHLSASDPVPAPIMLQYRLLNSNIKALLELPFVGSYIDTATRSSLTDLSDLTIPALQSAIARSDIAMLRSGTQRLVDDINAALQHITEASSAVQEASRLTVRARLNIVIALAALTALLAAYAIIHASHRERQAETMFMRSFVGLYSHIIQNRLSALRLFIDVGGSDPKVLARLRDRAMDAVEELSAVDIALRRSAYRQTTSDTAPLAQVIASLPTAPSQIALTPQAAAARVPGASISILLDELIKNAVDATEATKEPAIQVAAQINRSLIPWQRNSLAISVSDNGPGMTRQQQQDALRAFYTTKGRDHTGLGLTACNGMARSLKGRLRIKSFPGNGTVVTVSLPT